MDTLRLFSFMVLLQISWKVGFSSSPVSSIADQLLLLKPGERERFAERCFQKGVCSREDLNSFVWSSAHAKSSSEERFWYSYQCALSQQQDDCPVDGGWSSWGPWGACEHGCGVSLATRFRNCTQPAPLRGGFTCDGLASQVTNCESLTECKVEGLDTTNAIERANLVLQTFHRQEPELEMMCLRGRCSYQQVVDAITPSHLAEEYWTNLQCMRHLRGCPVDGGWSEWSSWSECSSHCGEGNSFRRRHCSNPEPRNGGAPCDGDAVEEGPCFDHSCSNIIGVLLSSWSQWTECPVTCGEGVISSTRTCHGAETCDVLKGEKVTSIERTAPCTFDPCEREGAWAEWNDWTVCTALCGNGTRYRVRECNNPTPIGEDNECEGEGYEKQECKHWESFCDGEDTALQERSEWNTWSQCSSQCKGGFRIRHRYCTGETEGHCYGSLYDMEACNGDKACPLDGGWSEWSEWSACSETCGEGTNDRYRICNNPYPQYEGKPCEGKSHQIQNCERLQCPRNLTGWGEWGSWSVCSEECGGGSMERSRECYLGGERLQRERCGGEFEQFSVCNFQQCSVDGNWAAWSEWNDCTESCGDGVRARDRTCTDPAPQSDGAACEGLGTEIEHCSRTPCQAHRFSVYHFDGSSFISYRRLARPTKHVLIFVSFLPMSPDGLLLLKREEESQDVFLIVKLFQSRVFLNAKAVGAEANVESGSVELSAWNHLEVGLSGNHAWLRVNDGVTNTTNFTGSVPYDLDWDLPLHVGGALPHLLSDIPGPTVAGFSGKISEVRMNYRGLRLSSQIDQWNGVGVPYVTLNVGEEDADVESQLTLFRGSSYMTVPVHVEYSFPLPPIVIELKVKLLGENGLLLYNVGEEPGSYLAVLIRNCVPVLNIDFGGDLLETNGGVIPLHQWVSLDIMIDGPTVEIRVDKGPAGQVSSPYENALYRPRNTLSVGGASLADMSVVTMAIEVSHGLHGYIFSTVVNGQSSLSEENAIESPNKTVNSAASTLSAHYQEIREPRGSSVVLRCNYQNLIPAHEPPMDGSKPHPLRWLRGDAILEVGDNMKIENDYSLTSNLHLHDLNEDRVGLYACLVDLGGRSLISQAFGVSVFDGEYYDFDPDIVDDVLIIVSACLFGLLVVATVVASFIPSLRKRFSLFRNVHTIFESCWGLPSRIGKRKKRKKATEPQDGRPALLDEINATYENFVKRVETAKERAKHGTVPGKLLNEIDDTYEQFLDRVRQARNLPQLDNQHLQEINSTYDKFLQRMTKDKKKDVLKEINETYVNFKDRELKGKTKRALMSEIRDKNPSSQKTKETMKAKVLKEINDTYGDFKMKQSTEEKRALLLNEVKGTRGRSQKSKAMKDQVNALLDEVGHTYENFKHREETSRRKESLMKEIEDNYEEFKVREEQAKRKVSLMQDIKDTKGRSQKSKSMKQNVSALVDEVGKTYDQFKDRERGSVQHDMHSRDADFDERKENRSAPKALLNEINRTYETFKDRELNQHRRATLMNELLTHTPKEDTSDGLDKDTLERKRMSRKKASVMKEVAALYDSTKDQEKRKMLKGMLMREIEGIRDDEQANAILASTPAGAATKKTVSFSSTPNQKSNDSAQNPNIHHEYDDEFSDFTSDDFLSDIDEKYESMDDLKGRISIEDDDDDEDHNTEEAVERNMNSSNGTQPRANQSMPPKRPSVKELAERLSNSLTLIPVSHTTSNINSLTSMSEDAISSPIKGSDLIPPPPPPPPQDFSTPLQQTQRNYDISHLTPYITSSAEMTSLDDEDENISSNNNRKVANGRMSSSTTTNTENTNKAT